MKNCSTMIVASLLFAVFAAACNQPAGTTTTTTVTPNPLGFNMNIGGNLPDELVRAPNTNACVSVLTGQSTGGNAETILDVEDFIDVARINLPNGSYRTSIQAVQLLPPCPSNANANTVTRVGPVVGPIDVSFDVIYFGAYSRVNPICINGSAIIFNSFVFTSVNLFDSFAQDKAKDRIWSQFDLRLAEQMNGLLNGSIATPVAGNPRCSNWEELDTSLFTVP